ncbi:MAG: hypothetical protein GY940_10860 [bacterium]|nr:hypothetical protein [bacterium]
MRKRSITFLIVSIVCFGVTLGVLFTGSLEGKKEKKEYRVGIKLEKVEREPSLEGKPVVQNGNLFDSRPMAVIWAPGPRGFRFRLYNKQNAPITILWNVCAFFDEKGNRHKVTYKGADVRSSMSADAKGLNPTVIKVGGNLQNVVFPFDSDYIEQEKDVQPFTTGGRVKANDSYSRAGVRIRPIFIDKYTEKKVKKLMKKITKKNKDMAFKTYIDNLTYRVEMSVKLGDGKPAYKYRFFFRAVLLK